jgi:hypothetical protein
MNPTIQRTIRGALVFSLASFSGCGEKEAAPATDQGISVPAAQPSTAQPSTAQSSTTQYKPNLFSGLFAAKASLSDYRMQWKLWEDAQTYQAIISDAVGR